MPLPWWADLIGGLETMLHRTLLYLALALSAAAQPRSGTCQITFRVTDERGVEQPAYRVHSFTDRDGENYAEFFAGQHGTVPCRAGPYFYDLRRANAASDRLSQLSSLTGSLTVNQPAVWLTVATSRNASISRDGRRGGSVTSSPVDYQWRGRILPPLPGPLWVRLTSLAHPEAEHGRLEAAVDSAGEFRVYTPFSAGQYSLSVTNAQGTVLYFALLTATNPLTPTPLEIRLPDSPPVGLELR